MTRCNTLLCGNEAVWQRTTPITGTRYKCDLCYDKNRLEYEGGWTRILPVAEVLASRIRSYQNQNT